MEASYIAEDEGTHTVPAVSLADLHDRIGGDEFVLDIEGGEYDMVEELSLLAEYCVAALFELHGSTEEDKQFMEKLRMNGVTVTRDGDCW